MRPTDLLAILAVAEKLKCNTRHAITTSGRQESVAEHSWRLALMAWLVQDEFPQADMNKVIRMCLVHDLGEAFTGDIPAFLKKTEDEQKEECLLQTWVTSFPEPYSKEILELIKEMNAMETKEAKIFKALDKMEAVIQHNEADISSWLPLEYDLQLVYGEENVQFSPWFCQLKEEVNRWTREKIREGK